MRGIIDHIASVEVSGRSFAVKHGLYLPSVKIHVVKIWGPSDEESIRRCGDTDNIVVILPGERPHMTQVQVSQKATDDRQELSGEFDQYLGEELSEICKRRESWRCWRGC